MSITLPARRNSPDQSMGPPRLKSISVRITVCKAILDKYSGSSKIRLVPICSNQKFNGYLKKIADLHGIDKDITSHLGRYTFATMVTLSKGILIEIVSRLLGHTSLVTTQIYAKVIDRKVADDMKFLI